MMIPTVVGIDLGTTTITALAEASGTVLARRTVPTPTGLQAIGAAARQAVRQLDATNVRAIGVTGQQHGVVIIDAQANPLSPFIGWQDRRADGPILEKARALAGDTLPRTGCRLANGYGAVSLYWMKESGILPAGTACTLMDWFTASLTGERPVTEATCAASLGCFDIVRGEWDGRLLDALGLPSTLFPPVVGAGAIVGRLAPAMAHDMGLPAGVPVHVGIGDNQASFLGSVAEPASTILVNVGTGGQVSAYSPVVRLAESIEARPFPGGGYLLVSAGLCGGAALASLSRFVSQIANQFGAAADSEGLLNKLVILAAEVQPGCDGLGCEPYFHGSRHDPAKRASFSGIGINNFTPGHMARAVMEGMARAFAESYDRLKPLRGEAQMLAGAGNGLRANPLLARIVSEAFGMTLALSPHPEEAAFGAARSTRLGV